MVRLNSVLRHTPYAKTLRFIYINRHSPHFAKSKHRAKLFTGSCIAVLFCEGFIFPYEHVVTFLAAYYPPFFICIFCLFFRSFLWRIPSLVWCMSLLFHGILSTFSWVCMLLFSRVRMLPLFSLVFVREISFLARFFDDSLFSLYFVKNPFSRREKGFHTPFPKRALICSWI